MKLKHLFLTVVSLFVFAVAELPAQTKGNATYYGNKFHGRRTSDAVGSGDIVEVVAGLKGDELLVDRPSERLSDGDSVRVAEAPSNGASSTSAARP